MLLYAIFSDLENILKSEKTLAISKTFDKFFYITHMEYLQIGIGELFVKMCYNFNRFFTGGSKMIAVKGYFDGQNYITEGNVKLKPNQKFIITFLDEFEPQQKTSCRGIAAQYANPKLIPQEELIAAQAFSGEHE